MADEQSQENNFNESSSGGGGSGSSNPFLEANFSPQTRKKYLTMRSSRNEARNDGAENKRLDDQLRERNGEFSSIRPEAAAGSTTTTTTTTTTTSFLAHQRINMQTLPPYEDTELQRTVHNEEFTQEANVCTPVPANEPAAAYEKNLGKHKKELVP